MVQGSSHVFSKRMARVRVGSKPAGAEVEFGVGSIPVARMINSEALNAASLP